MAKEYKMKYLFSQAIKSLPRSDVNCQWFNGKRISFFINSFTGFISSNVSLKESDKVCMSLTRFCFVAIALRLKVSPAIPTNNHYFVFFSCKIFYHSSSLLFGSYLPHIRDAVRRLWQICFPMEAAKCNWHLGMYLSVSKNLPSCNSVQYSSY